MGVNGGDDSAVPPGLEPPLVRALRLRGIERLTRWSLYRVRPLREERFARIVRTDCAAEALPRTTAARRSRSSGGHGVCHLSGESTGVSRDETCFCRRTER